MPASLRSPSRIMSSTPWMEVGCIGLMLVAFWGEIQCSWRRRDIKGQNQTPLTGVLGQTKQQFYYSNNHLDLRCNERFTCNKMYVRVSIKLLLSFRYSYSDIKDL